MIIFEDGTWSEPKAPAKWKEQWEKKVWYSKRKNQFILSDNFLRTHTCNQCSDVCIPDYIPHTFVYVGEL